MATVYGNAHITIVASSAESASEGFLQPRPSDTQKDSVPFRVSDKTFGRVTLQNDKNSDLFRRRHVEPIDRRAWTLQEQLVSRRLLRYASHTLQWRCVAGTMNLGQSLHVEHSALPSAKMTSQIDTDPTKACKEWKRMVEIYSRRSASFHKDKLPAIAALAEKYAPVLGQYYAGLWSHCFISQLDWTRWNNSGLQMGHSLYRAPSWSWASRDGVVSFDGRKSRIQLCTLVSADIRLKDIDFPYGEVLRGSITIRGRLLLGCPDNSPHKHFGFTVCAEQYFQESPSTTYFKTYFKQASSSTLPGQNRAVPLYCSFETARHVPFLGLVCKYPTSMRVDMLTRPVLLVDLLTLFAENEDGNVGDVNPMPSCRGLVLIPAGPDTFRRIGHFGSLPQSELDGIPEQEITIV
jgi:hypothetical protein